MSNINKYKSVISQTLNDEVVMETLDLNIVIMDITIPTGATLSFEFSNDDGATYNALTMINLATLASGTTTTVSGNFVGEIEADKIKVITSVGGSADGRIIVKFISNSIQQLKQLVASNEYQNQKNMNIRTGQIANTSAVLIQGIGENIDANYRQIMEGGLANEYLQLPVGNKTCDISSDTGGDTQTVLVIGWDDTGAILQESAVLNGQTRVQLSNSYHRIKAIIVTSNTQAGEPFMDGNVAYVYDRAESVTAGVPANFMGIIDLSKTISKMSNYFLKNGDKLYISDLLVGTDSGSTRTFEIVFQYKNTNDDLWVTVAKSGLANGMTEIQFTATPAIFNATYNTDVRIVGRRSVGSSSIDSVMIALHCIEVSA